MNVSRLHDWRLPGCGGGCAPRRHDPAAHEAYGYARALAEAGVSDRCEVGPLAVDFREQRAYVRGVPVALSGREYALLAYLARRAGRFCSNDDILAAVWGPEWVTGRRRLYPDGSAYRQDHRVVIVAASRLRLKLGPAGALIAARSINRVSGRCLVRTEVTP